MAITNALWEPDASVMLAAAIKFHGNITQLAEHFKVNRDTVYQYLKRNPEGKEIIDKVRGYNTEVDLDLAEHVIRYNLANFKNNPGLAQRASEKVIDKKGYMRGWRESDDEKETPKNQSDIDKDHLIMELKNKLAEFEANGNKSEAG